MNLKDDILFSIKHGRIGIIPLKGISMLPVFSDGDILYVSSQPQYCVGEIVVYSYPKEGYLVHRIIKIDKEIYFCKGDNSKRIEIIMKRQIIGKVVNFIKKGNQ